MPISILRNQSGDCVALLRNLEIGTHFRDSEIASRNLEIAHIIPNLRGTYTNMAEQEQQLGTLYPTVDVWLSIVWITHKPTTKQTKTTTTTTTTTSTHTLRELKG